MNHDAYYLQIIQRYHMSPEHAKAFKVACLFSDHARKLYPNYRHLPFPKGDPRKSELFRYSYKLVKEATGILPDQELETFIIAQLKILGSIRTGAQTHALIHPNCLSGEKAWTRWQLYKNKLEKAKPFVQSKTVIPNEKIERELIRAKHFLFVRFNRHQKEDILQALHDGRLFQWVRLSQLTPYYLVVSPLVREWVQAHAINLLEQFTIDTSLYIVDENIRHFFKKEFAYEF